MRVQGVTVSSKASDAVGMATGSCHNSDASAPPGDEAFRNGSCSGLIIDADGGRMGQRARNPHLPDGNGVQLLDAFSLRQAHFDEFCIQTLNVRQHQKLLDGSAVPHIAFESGIGVAPLFGCLAKQSDVEKISFAGVGTSRLRGAHHSRDEARLNRLGMDPVVEL